MDSRQEKEFTEEELMNVMGGFQHMYGNEHPFNEEELYGKTQKEKLEELKAQLEEMEESKTRKGR